MKQNQFDLITDELKSQIKLAGIEIGEQFKNTRPYRQERKQRDESVQDFLNLTPDNIAELRNVYGDIVIDRYLDSMKGMLRQGAKDGR